MPRHDREVAQRYASKKRKKRSTPVRSSTAVAEPRRAAPVSDIEADEVEEAVPASPSAASGGRPAIRFTTRTGTAQPQRVAPRRTFASYADEYRYVVRDLQRVVVVAGGLLLALIVLSFFIS